MDFLGFFLSILGLLGTPIGSYMAQRSQIHAGSPRILRKDLEINFQYFVFATLAQNGLKVGPF